MLCPHQRAEGEEDDERWGEGHEGRKDSEISDWGRGEIELILSLVGKRG